MAEANHCCPHCHTLSCLGDCLRNIYAPPLDPTPTPNPSSNRPGVHTAKEPETLAAILTQRGSRYGDFSDNAHISQSLKQVADAYYRPCHTSLHREAIDMILHKLARILAGDPNYDDSWIDIAGYAQLVVDRLKKVNI